MASSIAGGSLGRWFEQLCRIRHQTLRSIVTERNEALAPRALPAHGGVYAFWWTGELSLLSAPDCNRDLILVGPKAHSVHLMSGFGVASTLLTNVSKPLVLT
jgi:hypothetical protein